MDSVTLGMFAFTCWLAFYLIARSDHPRLRLTGAGLLAYALVLGLGYTSTGVIWERINWALRLLPSLLWTGAILYIDDRIRLNRSLLPKIWKWFLLPITLLAGIGFVTEIDFIALYFPYVAGLRPYSRGQERDLAPEEQEALNWMQAYVPERTLYNWQNAGAKLVANDLWELNFPN